MPAGEQGSTLRLVVLETWQREGRVRLPTIVMLETWLREREQAPSLSDFFFLIS